MQTVSNAVMADQQTAALLGHLGRGGVWQYWWEKRLAGDGREGAKVSTWFRVGELAALPDWRRGDIYFSVNPAREVPQADAKGKVRSAAQVRGRSELTAAVNCLFAEFDAKDYGGDKAAALAHVERLAGRPSVLVDSGGGYHAYWLFEAPVKIEDPLDLEAMEDLQGRWVGFVGGDGGAKDLARVLRAPGTVNHKYDPVRPVCFVWAEFDRLYRPERLQALMGSQAGRSAPGGNGNGNGHGNGHHGGAMAGSQAERYEWARGLLERLGPWRCEDYQAWVKVGMALKELGPDGLTLWDGWSQGSGKYLAGECGRRWEGFKPNGVTVGSLYQWANEDDPGGGRTEVKRQAAAVPEPAEAPEPAKVEDQQQGPEDEGAGPDRRLAGGILAPELPGVAQLPDELTANLDGAGQWLSDYITFGKKASPMTPRVFHEALGLTLLATATARRVELVVGPGQRIYPNLYMLLVAHSTLYAKSTAFTLAGRLLDQAGCKHLTLPVGITPQSLISELTGRAPENFKDWERQDRDNWQKERPFAARRAWLLDEAAGLLDCFEQKNTEDLALHVLKLYDCPDYLTFSTIKRGRETVRDGYLTICGPTTPAAMRKHLGNDKRWGDGIFARFLLVTPDEPPRRSFYPAVGEIPGMLAGRLGRLALELLPAPVEVTLGEVQAPGALRAELEPGVWDMFDHYHAGLYELIAEGSIPERLTASYGRLHAAAMKTALLLATADWADAHQVNKPSGPPVVTARHWARAQTIIEGYRASLHRIIDDASRVSGDDDLELKINRYLSLAGANGLTERELAIAAHMTNQQKRIELAHEVERMQKDGLICQAERKGRKSVKVWILSKD